METTGCILCGADSAELIAEQRDILFDGEVKFPWVRCRSCGLIYLRDRPTALEIGEYYPAEYQPYRGAIQDEHHAIIRWARSRNIDKKRRIAEKYHGGRPGRLLDVGCSTGIFLDALKRAGWQTTGVEINPGAVQYARQRFNLEVREGQLCEAHFPPGSFDVITFWDVLEHTFNPLENLLEANRLLTENGIAILSIPNWNSLDKRIFGMDWLGFVTPRHLYVFPQPVLRLLIEKAGFRVLNVSSTNGYFSFLTSLQIWLKDHVSSPIIRASLLRLLNIPGMRYLFQPLFSILESAGRGGILVVIAQKDRPLT